MAVGFKPNKWCTDREQRIAAQRNTARLRSIPTFALTGLPIGGSGWHCPNCGSTKVTPYAAVEAKSALQEVDRDRRESQAQLAELLDLPQRSRANGMAAAADNGVVLEGISTGNFTAYSLLLDRAWWVRVANSPFRSGSQGS